jgi:hypothetical protein
MSKGFMEWLPWLIPGSTSLHINAILALIPSDSPGMGMTIFGALWN